MSLDAATVNAQVAAAWPTSGVECLDVGPRFAVARMAVAPGSIRPGGFISGPTQFSLADCALWYAVFGVLDRVEPMALTSELSIRYLRPAQGTVIVARADIESAGRRNVIGTVRLWVEGAAERLVSTAQGTYVLPA